MVNAVVVYGGLEEVGVGLEPRVVVRWVGLVVDADMYHLGMLSAGGMTILSPFRIIYNRNRRMSKKDWLQVRCNDSYLSEIPGL